MTDENPNIQDLFKRLASERGFDVEEEKRGAETILTLTAALILNGDLDATFTAPGFRYALFTLVSSVINDPKYEAAVTSIGTNMPLSDFLMMLVIESSKLGIAMGIIASEVCSGHDIPGSRKN